MTSSDLRRRLMQFMTDSGRVPPEHLDANVPLITSELIDSETLFELSVWIEEEVGRALDLTRIALPDDWDTVERIVAFIEREQDALRSP